jgi:hypothetical protein
MIYHRLAPPAESWGGFKRSLLEYLIEKDFSFQTAVSVLWLGSVKSAGGEKSIPDVDEITCIEDLTEPTMERFIIIT